MCLFLIALSSPVSLPRERGQWAYTSKYEAVINTQGSFVKVPISCWSINSKTSLSQEMVGWVIAETFPQDNGVLVPCVTEC